MTTPMLAANTSVDDGVLDLTIHIDTKESLKALQACAKTKCHEFWLCIKQDCLIAEAHDRDNIIIASSVIKPIQPSNTIVSSSTIAVGGSPTSSQNDGDDDDDDDDDGDKEKKEEENARDFEPNVFGFTFDNQISVNVQKLRSCIPNASKTELCIDLQASPRGMPMLRLSTHGVLAQSMRCIVLDGVSATAIKDKDFAASFSADATTLLKDVTQFFKTISAATIKARKLERKQKKKKKKNKKKKKKK